MEALNGLQTNIAVRGHARQHDKSKLDDVERNLQHSGISVSMLEGVGQGSGSVSFCQLTCCKVAIVEGEGCRCVKELAEIPAFQ